MQVDERAIQKSIAKLTAAQREALLHRQLAMFVPDPVRARGLTAKGITEGSPPRLTPLGEAVVARLEAGHAV